MPPISLEERQKVNHQLKKLGFGGIHDPNLFAQIATLYRTHDSFRGLLMSTMPDQRRIAYEAIKPHLCFVAKPLDVYEMEMKQKAEREQWDVIDPENKHFPKPFEVGEIESQEYKLARQAELAIEINEAQQAAKGFLTVTCPRCTKEQTFPGETRVDASILAKEAGWRLHPAILCPECAVLYHSMQ